MRNISKTNNDGTKMMHKTNENNNGGTNMKRSMTLEEAIQAGYSSTVCEDGSIHRALVGAPSGSYPIFE